MKPSASRWTECKPLVHALFVLPLALFALGCPDSTVEVKPTAPVVKITTPTQAAVVYPGPVTFAGTVEDQIDAPAQIKATWHITLGGVEETCDSTPDANGKVSCTMTLDEGDYQLALSATNTSDLTGTAAVGFSVENFGPAAIITAPKDGTTVLEGDMVRFEGTARDPDEDPSELKVEWSSDKDGDLGASTPDSNGLVTLETDALSAHSHTITLSVTDPLGEVASASILLTVKSCPDEDNDGYASCTRPGETVDCDDSNAAVYPGAAEVCDGLDNDCNGKADDTFDEDGDGYTTCPEGEEPVDCNDSDASIHPDATEFCDGLDNNCDTQIDEEIDGDGDGITPCKGDCDDGNAAVYEGAEEICDGADNNCDGDADEGFDEDNDDYTLCLGDCNDADSTVHPESFEVCNRVDDDCNGTIDDGYDLDGDSFTSCGLSAETADCNDVNPAVYPGATELCDRVDNNCNGQVDEGFDQDGDGFTTCTGDCDDTRSDVSPAVAELCDGKDNNCNGKTDEGFDGDNDGVTSCAGDCNDSNPAVKPGANETCNGIDDDCDGTVDGSFDNDGDGYTTCGSATAAKDCNDSNSDINPGATEVCDGKDNNCNGLLDEGYDQDGDGYATCATADRTADCDDHASGINPGAAEKCDSVDNNCDGKIDENFDQDADGFTTCQGDCDDTRAAVYPGAAELCNGLDDNCNARIDDGYDQDGDGYTTCNGDCNDSNPSVHKGAPEQCNGVDDNCDGKIDDNSDADKDGYTTCGGDCDDSNASIHPGVKELCNGADDNCDGKTDEGFDADKDGYTTCNGDCNDSNPGINPGVVETCNGRDDNCDGKSDEGFDADKDGYTTCNGDCDDANPAVHLNATETCNGIDDNCDGKSDEGFDVDKDGYTTCNGDCNDSNASVNPGVTETCDGVDNNCDGKKDEGFDKDADGYTTCNGDCDDSNPAIRPGVTEACNGKDDNCDGKIDETFDADKDGYTTCNGDCDDTKSAVNPGAAEICDGLDNNCNSKKDEGFDLDVDGYTTCNGDCDDTNPAVHLNATESCNGIDDNCDGKTDEGFDVDKDGYTTCAGDCNDASAAINPGALETCDGVDNNCNGKKDEGFDADNDGYTTCNGDCDDANPAIHKNATELCNGVDDNCDGKVDENSDADKDGYTNCAGDCDDTNPAIHPGVTEACNAKDDNCDGKTDEGFDKDADGYTTCNGDCDDTNAAIRPGATETCNGKDDNCDSKIDEGFDKDSDGYTTCNGDCDDANAAIHPGVTETCNGKDDNCDGQTDEGLKKTYYVDSDKDGYGNPASSTQACTAPTGYVTDNTDCDDSKAAVHPGVTESCNGVDDNCDGQTDEGLLKTWYRDGDSDGYGTSTSTTQGCSAPSGYVSSSTDCNDADATVNPGATELCNSKDDNCNGQTDEGVQSTWYQDADSDGYGNAAKSSVGCTKPAGYVTDKTDCNDASAAIHPNATEVTCNAVDENCNGTADDHPDKDADSYDVCSTGVSGADSKAADCDDSDALTYPGAPERFDGKDNNCDGVLESQIVLSDAFSYTGSVAGANAGFSVAGPGDVNLDTYGDVVVGAPGVGSGKGAAHLVLGHMNWADDVALTTGSITLTEDSAGSKTGFSVGPAGDLNKDGYMDFAVGAPYYAGSYPNGGVAYILFGRATWANGLMSSTANSSVKGLNSNTEVGMSVGGGGDVNGDGIADLLIGAPWPGGTGSGAGWIMILPGKISGWTPSISPDNLAKLTGTPGEGVGYSVATAGNVTGDAYGDMVIGSQYNSSSYGDAWLVTGRTDLAAGVTYGPSALGGNRYYGKTSNEYVGSSVSAAGDVNGDGKMDFLVGRKTDGNGTDGKAYLFFGSSSMPSSSTAQSAAPVRFDGLSSDKCPCSVAGAGDVDDDGYADFIIGVAKNTEVSGGGKVYLFYGGPNGTFATSTPLADADMVFYGEASGDQAGFAVSAAGDVDGDGFGDFAVGAPYNDQAGADAGKVYILQGFPRN